MAFLNKKIIIFGWILALALAGGVVWFVSENSKLETAAGPKVITSSISKTIAEAPDSDADGLKDWEEQLWGTDPKNPDTDADGTNDNEEIKLGRNPLVAGPNDYLAATPPTKQREELSTTRPGTSKGDAEQNLTDKLAKDFLTNYLQLKKHSGGESLSLADQEKILSSFWSGIPQEQSKDIYTEADIKKTSSATKEEIVAYLTNVFRILMVPEVSVPKNELVILLESLTLEDPKLQEQLRITVRSYEDTLNKLMAVAAPNDYVKLHLNLVNRIANMRVALAMMPDLSKDPAQGIANLNYFLRERNELANVLNNFIQQAQKYAGS